jgi:hypothetical protein
MSRKIVVGIALVLIVAALSSVVASRMWPPSGAAVSAVAPGTSPVHQTLIATDLNHIAIRGYDTVAYFTDGKPVMGSRQHSYSWNDAVWQFASAQHRDMFVSNPEAYMPQYGGYCAGSMAEGNLTVANPNAWVIVDGKLYMFAGSKFFGSWTNDEITRADAQWRSRMGN